MGNIEAGEEVDRAVLRKKARVPKKGSIPKEQEEINKKNCKCLFFERIAIIVICEFYKIVL